ncbi:MAG: alkaline phosphatase PhoX [Myxococcota bacterium]
MTGPAGADGSDGADGTNGVNGTDGSDGRDGTSGTDGSNGTDGQDGFDGARSIIFQDVQFPATDAEKRAALASETVMVNGVQYDIAFNTVMRSGDVPTGGGTFGLIVDQDMNPVLESDGSQFISNSQDFNSILDINGDGSELYQVTHFESRPGGMYLTELSQDAATGELTAVSTEAIDFSGVDGLWVPCAGSVTPWMTHLGGEEYPPNGRAWEDLGTAATETDYGSYTEAFFRYYGLDTYTDADANGAPDNITGAAVNAVMNPYQLGYPVEVTVATGGSYTVEKHYAMGRVAIELAYVMPDQRTVYITDDGTNVGLYMFVADAAGDLSSGELYAAKWLQTSPDGVGGGSADLEWISLGATTNDAMDTVIAGNPVFSDMFETADVTTDGDGFATGCSDETFTLINAGFGAECLKVVSGMEAATSRLETRRYAAYLGATTEFRKEEGIAHDPDTNTLFVAMSEVERGMETFARSGSTDTRYDVVGTDDIRVEYNDCGVVYALDLAANSTIGSGYVAENMYAFVEGVMVDYPEGSVYENNSCSISGIANPDNVSFIPGYGNLIIGEDTGSGHQNDVIWAYDIATERLDRIQTTPYGSETTSPYWYQNIGGYAYMASVIQHPFGESDGDQLIDPAEARGYVGYIGPFPAMDY